MKSLDRYNCKKEERTLCFRTCKTNTVNSILEVNAFLNNFKHFSKCIKLYYILKK